MIASFGELLRVARDGGRATLAFTVYDIASATAVVEAAERRRVGVVLLVSSQAMAERGGPALVTALRALAEDAAVEACVQLDHEGDLSAMRSALDAGAGALMVDGSRLPYEENVALVVEGARLAARYGAEIEAELGRIEGDEEVAAAAGSGALTDPEQARDFVERTGAHCLAVSIGNSHGSYAAPPALDWRRLEALRAAAAVPLSLHGASGLAAATLRRAVDGGIAKVNVNTELREAWFAGVLAHAEPLADGAQLLRLQREQRRAVGAVAEAKLLAVDPAAADTEETRIG